MSDVTFIQSADPVATEVEAAYRWILGRQADEAGKRHHVEAITSGAASPKDIRTAMLQSDEFAEGRIVPVVGRFATELMGKVDCHCPAEIQRTMLEGIARHWARFGHEAPHWSVLTETKFTPESVDRHIDEFYASGRSSVDLVEAILLRNGIEKSQINSVMDFGCGVGRLTLAFAERYTSVVGIDISPGHLSVAGERARHILAENARFRRVASVDEIGQAGKFDLIVSFIVLQHNPPPIALSIISELLGSLNTGGVAVFQMPTFIRGYHFEVNEYLASEKPAMEVNAIPQREIFAAIRGADCDLLEVREDKAIANMAAVSQTFAVQKRL